MSRMVEKIDDNTEDTSEKGENVSTAFLEKIYLTMQKLQENQEKQQSQINSLMKLQSDQVSKDPNQDLRQRLLSFLQET